MLRFRHVNFIENLMSENKCLDKIVFYRQVVAANVKRLRQEKKIAQKELAKRSHVGVATISNLERALYNPDLSVLLSIADVLGVSLLDLFVSDEEFLQNNVVNSQLVPELVSQELVRFIETQILTFSPEKLKFLCEQVRLLSRCNIADI